MQLVTKEGLKPVTEAERRCTVVPTWNTNAEDAKRLIQFWADKTPDKARRLLARPDVQVTNQSDKEPQLEKLSKLNGDVQRFVAIRAQQAEA